ncbi:MAG: ABC transporter substrate-binding protein [Geminicoccaceae bacterium]
MRKLNVLLLAAILLAAPVAAFANDKTIEVIHWWTSGGESAAVAEFASAFEKAGGEWIDSAIAGGENARNQGINRIIGGDAPSAMQFNTGKQFDELVEAGFLRDLEDVAQEGGWRDALPDVIIEAATRDDKFYAVPVNIHGDSWIWYNKEVLEKAGIEPPTSYQDLIAAAPALREQGVIPLAFGGQPWQERLTFNAVLLAEGGPDLYLAILGGNDVEAVRGEGFRQVAETFVGLRDLVDEGSPGRNWNDATAMVITGQAAAQVMGDWAKGEFIAAGLEAGEDYVCVVPNEQNGYVLGGDVFVFPQVEDPAHQAGQITLATIMMSPDTQVAFYMKKGSVPVRLDVDVSAMDPCAQHGMSLLQDESKQVPGANYLATPDLMGALDDVVTEFWNTPSMDVDTFVENYVSAIETAG